VTKASDALSSSLVPQRTSGQKDRDHRYALGRNLRIVANGPFNSDLSCRFSDHLEFGIRRFIKITMAHPAVGRNAIRRVMDDIRSVTASSIPFKG
jgi:hypothetical protein